jgi:5-formyltetrahydrofolate cyclo-ligase
MTKADLRHKHLNLRKQEDRLELLKRSSFIIQQLIPHLEKVLSVGIYISVDQEVNTRELIDLLFKSKKRVCVPKIVDQRMIFVDIQSLDECKYNGRLLEPVSNTVAKDPELQIIPMLAYNSRNYRLGYGKGYYDAYLNSYGGQTIGLCYAFNYDEELIEDVFDISCQLILTDSFQNY